MREWSSMTEIQEPKKRHRNVAHAWWDKRVVRFFRKKFDKHHYKNLRSVYLALCEVDSDFGETGEIRGFTKTIATYAGMSEDTIRPYLRALQKADIIDYEQQNTEGQFGGTALFLYKWEEPSEENERQIFHEEKQKIINRVLENRMQRTKEPAKYRPRKNPATVNPGNGKTGSYKNNTKVLSTSKNSKEENNIYPNNDSQDNLSTEKFPSTKEKNKQSIKKRNEQYIPLASKLAGIVQTNKNIKINQAKIKSWANEIRKLVEIDEVDPDRIDNALDWYSDNIGDNFVPVIESGASLYNKFTRLEDAMKRGRGLPTQDGKNSKPVSATKTSPSPGKLIKQRIPNSVMRKSFFKNCYKPAKGWLGSNNNEEVAESQLVEDLVDFYFEIEKKQNNSPAISKNRSLFPYYSPMSLINSYIEWLNDNGHWITNRTSGVFRINSGLFSRFKSEYAREVDNQSRDPLTGKSRMKE